MYKHIGAILFGLFCTLPLHAAWTESECNADKGGTIVEVGGDSFCKAKSGMNWWSAYAWCTKMGGRMPTISELCPNKTITVGTKCGRDYPGTFYIWSSTPNGDRMWTAEKNAGMSSHRSRNDNWEETYCLK